MIVVGVKKWAWCAIAVVALATLAGTTIGSWLAAPPRPRPPAPCTEKADIRNSGNDTFTCGPGQRLEVYPIANTLYALMKCVCLPTTKGSNMSNENPDATAPTPPADASAQSKDEKISELKAQIAELEGKEEGQQDEGDTPTKPKIETHNKFGVNTRDGGIVVGNNLALINGVSVTDAINLAAWLTIVADRGLAPRATIDNAELFDAIVEANPET